ncbi:hypothetical protein Ccrd_010169 [Cynara cardunculus var. scolymus]|uniref:Ulp1 protease family, C-terminal catalytic domain-containing protein n=1 Tax=Cynara cardunculus var. scolymus TaxID=59895 RepID=A0A103YLL7_CYNCS|nr:hypothetical protein Ccrd_010169 [Cynara cardunculus var. scolymus]
MAGHDGDIDVVQDPTLGKIKKVKITTNKTSSSSHGNTEPVSPHKPLVKIEETNTAEKPVEFAEEGVDIDFNNQNTKKRGKKIVNPSARGKIKRVKDASEELDGSDFVQNPTLGMLKKVKVTTAKKASSSHGQTEPISPHKQPVKVVKPNRGPQQAKGINHETDKGIEEEPSSDTSEVQYRVLRTRTSPRTQHETVHTLNDSQRDAIKSMRLGSLLDIKIDGVPSRLGFYVVDNLTNMRLNVRHDSIPITISSTHDLLGLPTGGIDILCTQQKKPETNINDMFRKQFVKKNMRPKDVMKLIEGTGDASGAFKINFLVLFVNLMGEIKLLKDMIDNILATKCKIEERLSACLSKYHSDEAFISLAGELNDIFKNYKKHEGSRDTVPCANSALSKEKEEAITDNVASTAIGTSREKVSELISSDICVGQRVRDETSIENDLILTPLSQYWLSQTFHKICDETVENSISSKQHSKDVLNIRPPHFDLGISPTKTVEPSSVIKPTRKEQGKGICIEDEATLKKCNSDIVFELENGTNILRGNLASLASNSMVYTNVIDGWAELLNYEEMYRSRDSLCRNNLAKSARFDMNILKMRNMDLHLLMIKHQKVVRHLTWQEIDETRQERLQMSWQTKENFDDGGVFLMRHMETWMGDERSWKTGFTT